MDTDKNQRTEPTEEEIKEVYARYGLTSYVAQLFEVELGQFLFHIIQMQAEPWTEEEADSIINDISQKTLGRLLNELKKKTTLEPELEQKLKDAVKNRNYLTHHFFYKNSFKFVTNRGQLEMIEELNSLREQFQEAEVIALTLSKVTRKIIGFDEEKLQSEAKNMMEGQIKRYEKTN